MTDFASALIGLLNKEERWTRREWVDRSISKYVPGVHPAGTYMPFVVLMPKLELPPFNTSDTSRKVNDRTAQWIGEDTPLNCQPYFAHYDPASNHWQPGWTPQTVDALAQDWFVITEKAV